MERRKRQSITNDAFARQGELARSTPERLPDDLGTLWVAQIDAPDMPLQQARQRYAVAQEGAHRKALLLAIVRAERRLAVQYAPQYTWQCLSGEDAALKGEEYRAYYGAVAQGE